jgi:hypothetical protein
VIWFVDDGLTLLVANTRKLKSAGRGMSHLEETWEHLEHVIFLNREK